MIRLDDPELDRAYLANMVGLRRMLDRWHAGEDLSEDDWRWMAECIAMVRAVRQQCEVAR